MWRTLFLRIALMLGLAAMLAVRMGCMHGAGHRSFARGTGASGARHRPGDGSPRGTRSETSGGRRYSNAGRSFSSTSVTSLLPGSVWGPNRAATRPSGATTNLVKFHGISPGNGESFVSQW